MPMNIEVRLFATFRKGRWKTKILNVEEETNIQKVLKLLDIKEESLGIALINGRHSDVNSKLEDDDVLALFPPIGGG